MRKPRVLSQSTLFLILVNAYDALLMQRKLFGARAKSTMHSGTATLVTNSGRSAWFVGVLVLAVYLVFAMTLYLLPPR